MFLKTLGVQAVISGCLALAVWAQPAAASGTPLPVPWETALTQAAQTGESILVEVGATWCHACLVLATTTMADSTVQRALSRGWIAGCGRDLRRQSPRR